jgi:hypothetical protein
MRVVAGRAAPGQAESKNRRAASDESVIFSIDVANKFEMIVCMYTCIGGGLYIHGC